MCLEDKKYLQIHHSEGIACLKEVQFNPPVVNDEHVLLILRPKYVGICSSDIKEITGSRIDRSDFGHECLLEVIESDHINYKPSDLVVLDPHINVERDSAFSELMCISASPKSIEKALYKVQGLNPLWILVEPLACVIHACEHVSFREVDKILIVGAGFFGYLFYKYLESKGLSCTITNRSNKRLEYLKSFDEEINTVYQDDLKSNFFDVCIFSGSSIDYDFMLNQITSVKPQGCAIMFSPVEQDFKHNMYDIRNHELYSPIKIKHKIVYFQGTSGAQDIDFNKSIKSISNNEFSQSIEGILDKPLNIVDGTKRINALVNGDISYKKSYIEMSESKNKLKYINYELKLDLSSAKTEATNLHVEKVSLANVESLIELYEFVSSKWDWGSRLNWSTNQWFSHISKNTNYVFLIKGGVENKENQGFFEFYSYKNNSIKIKYIALMDSWIGKGIGCQILIYIIALAKGMGFDEIYVETRSTDHKNALKNYYKQGFNLLNSVEVIYE